MFRFRRTLAIAAGKAVILLSRLLGNQGTDFPGRIARRIDPDILKDLAGNIQKEIIVVTGTNGKTTTTNMIAAMIAEKQESYVHNQAGANMMTGITTAFIQSTNLLGNKPMNYGLLETDEANVPHLLKELTPQYILITNFFRDQLDRYGELDHTIRLIKEAVKDTSIELVLNADDPLVSNFQDETGLHCWYYGFDKTPYDSQSSDESREGRFCIVCGSELQYDRFHYAQLGKFHCPQCGNTNPKRHFTAGDLEMNPTLRFKVDEVSVSSSYQGFYNAYNILAAVSLCSLLEISGDIIERAILNYQPRAGRMEHFVIDGKRVVLILVKNPTGLNQSLSILLQDPSAKNVFMALNDNAADGRDISWIWDAEVEMINHPDAGVQCFVASGQRSGDMAVRVKYAGVSKENIILETSLEKGIQRVIEKDSERSYVLSTYTALFECRKILSALQRHSKPHEPSFNDRREKVKDGGE
ncbi:MAG: MurT ligase domain-containing protein [Bacillota bacterium]|nr:MurT ligase domain-containing protein [Bacillota bacterium]